ncbi:hypothetical protein PMIN01_11784 [Paraphaeosphaeria minitans]|uniref:Uncharacterized protein n=1 Tax=Paraphaeosphaeria minitans TaxID=565426 RepID=A0A9P6KKQ9_9PLEO|nr:hypothetical protein PMIN01_11784 [Paraphaeosphaeria minitans]
MANSLLIATLVLFIVGLTLSTAVMYRDCMAIRRVEGAIRWRQCILVSLTVVQVSFLSFEIAAIIQHRLDLVEPGITWALQIMACTNWPLVIYVALVPSVVLNGVIYLKVHGNAPVIYQLVLLIVIAAGSAFMAWFGVSRRREHQRSRGSLNRSMRNLFVAVIVTNVIAVTTVLCTCCFVLSYPKHWISRLALGSEPSLELRRRPPTAP